MPCLEELFARSYKNLGVDAVDVLWLADAAELQLPVVGRVRFLERVLAAFRLFEDWRSKGSQMPTLSARPQCIVFWAADGPMRTAGRIKAYGLSAWQSFHLPASHPQSLSLEELVDLAQQAGGFESNGFRFIQVRAHRITPLEQWSWQMTAGAMLPWWHLELGVCIPAQP